MSPRHGVMRWLGGAVIAIGATAIALVAAADRGAAQPLNKLPPARAPCSVLSGRPCHPSFCGVFHTGPCFPQYGPAIGTDFRLTIVSSDDDPRGNPAPGAAQGDETSGAAPAAKPIESIGDMYAALRGCWVPPPQDVARHGMQYTIRFAFKRDGDIVAPPFVTYASHDAPAETRAVYRDAVNAALNRCTPLHFSHDMVEAVVGHPIAIRFVDDRTIDSAKSLQ